MKVDPNLYIEDMIVTPLRRFADGLSTAKETPWDTMGLCLHNCIQNGSTYMYVLHTLMQPFYEMYFYGEPQLSRSIPGPEHVFMKTVTEADPDFCLWASNQNLIAAAEGWGDYMKRTNNDHIHYFFYLLELLISDKYHQNWEEMAGTLKESLFQAEVYSDYKTDELLCILHGMTMIMLQDWPLQKKKDVFGLLCGHWGFMKHVYSIMTRHIIGCKLPNFAAVTNNVMISNSNLPHLDIFYCALVERMDDLGLDEKKYKKLDDARLKLLERMNRREPSETLYELCDTLFPEEFQLMLRHRPPSYGELKDENQKIKDENKIKDLLLSQMELQSRKLEEQLANLTEAYQKAIEASIPVEDILQRLLKESVSTAWNIYGQLDHILKTHPIWRNYDIKIYEAIRQKEENENKKKNNVTRIIKISGDHPTYNETYNE
jgi:hypothetical protein